MGLGGQYTWNRPVMDHVYNFEVPQEARGKMGLLNSGGLKRGGMNQSHGHNHDSP